MTDNRKEQERAELHRTIWGIANDLRGSADAWDFNQYVLGILFYRYISENITAYINEGEHEVGERSFDYAKLSDEDAETARADLVSTKVFFILPSERKDSVFEDIFPQSLKASIALNKLHLPSHDANRLLKGNFFAFDNEVREAQEGE